MRTGGMVSGRTFDAQHSIEIQVADDFAMLPTKCQPFVNGTLQGRKNRLAAEAARSHKAASCRSLH
jgi:hypothetical protein